VSETLQGGWSELIEEIDRKHEAAHRRLREALSHLETTVADDKRHFQIQADALRGRMGEIAQLASTPVDATKLVLSTKAIISLVCGILVIAASYWALAGKIDQQQKDATANAKLQEVQMKALADAVADAKAIGTNATRQNELLRYELQSLKEIVVGKGKAHE
jgi:uncharacterized membrane protein YwzB